MFQGKVELVYFVCLCGALLFIALVLGGLWLMSISAMAAGQENYYVQLTRQEDYYAQGGEKPGTWYGAGAKRLGLEGEVRPEHLTLIMQGRGPDGALLVQLQKNRQHRSGWSASVNDVKPLSVLWALSDRDGRERIDGVRGRALGVMLDYMQEHVIVSRRGQGGAIREPAGMVAAIFEHCENRNGGPQKHTHILWANVGVRSDQTTATLDSRLLYDHQLAAGAVYRSALASLLKEELGLRIRPDGEFFKIDGIPDALVERFSTRRQEILQSLKEKGIAYSPAAAEIAALDTRAAKVHVAPEVLSARWRQIGEEYGFGPVQAAALMRHSEVISPSAQHTAKVEAEAEKIVSAAAEKLGEQCGGFTERALVRATAVAAQHRAIHPTPVLDRIAHERQPGGNLLTLDGREREPRLATRVSGQLLETLGNSAESLRRNNAHHLRPERIERFVEERHSLSPEQKQAFLQIASGPGAFQCVDGLAGTGKTTLLRAAHEAWREAGYQVIGCAPTGRAARELQLGSGIQSRTVAGLLWRSDPTLGQVLGHEARQVGRALAGKPTYAMGAERLTGGTILVVDEASIIGAQDLNRLLRVADHAKAKVVLVGDRRQFEAITMPGAFDFLVEKFGAAKLADVQRQHEPWQQDAIRQVAAGDVRGALTQFALAGQAHVCQSPRDARQELAFYWQQRKTADLSKTLIIARTREGVAELNALAQAARHQNGELGTVLKQRLPGTWVYRNDRVTFTKNSKPHGYLNGDMGTVERIGLDTLTIRMDRTQRRWGREEPIRVTLDRSHYKHLQLAYAVTAYKAQGLTVDRAFVATELSDLEPHRDDERRTAYVQLSRAREETQVFLTMREAGEDLGQIAELARQHQEQLQQQQRQQQITEEMQRRLQEQQQQNRGLQQR